MRDVIFKHQSLFRDELHIQNEQVSQEEIEVLDLPQSREDEVQWTDLLDPQQSLLPFNNNEDSMNDTTHPAPEIAILTDVELPKDRGYLPTPEPSIFGHTTSPQLEEEDDDIHSKELPSHSFHFALTTFKLGGCISEHF